MRTARHFARLALLPAACLLASCGSEKPKEQFFARNHKFYDPTERLPEARESLDQIDDKRRIAIVLRRVVDDTHGLKAKYPDEKLRILLEVIAGDSGVDPQKIDLGAPLTGPPTSFKQVDMVELVVTVERIFGVEIPAEKFQDGRATLAVKDLLSLVQAR